MERNHAHKIELTAIVTHINKNNQKGSCQSIAGAYPSLQGLPALLSVSPTNKVQASCLAKLSRGNSGSANKVPLRDMKGDGNHAI